MLCEFLKVRDWSLWTKGPRILSSIGFTAGLGSFTFAEKADMPPVNFRKGLIINCFLLLHKILWFQFEIFLTKCIFLFLFLFNILLFKNN